jgi:3'-phosphoadenosine 5'-phosphosulfate sulfotransferase (PAPS reductase)/FAD synthetase
VFPHAELLYSLATDEPTSLWMQLNRILVPQGLVQVIFDVLPDDTRTLTVKNIPTDISLEFPEDHIWRMATNASFTVEIEPLSKKQSYDLGSDYGKNTAHKMRLDSKHRAYRLLAKKQYSF